MNLDPDRYKDLAPTEQDYREREAVNPEPSIANRKPQTPSPLTLHRSRGQAGDDLFLGKQIERDSRDHGQADEG